jgi:hypothetical protein
LKHEATKRIKHVFDFYDMEPSPCPGRGDELISGLGSAFIYLMGCEEYFKVGVANDPNKRLINLQCGNPYPISLLASWYSYTALVDEGRLHDALAMYHKSGEWFKLPEEVVAKMCAAESVEELIDSLTHTHTPVEFPLSCG